MEGKSIQYIESFASVLGLVFALKVREYVTHVIVYAAIRQTIARLRIEKTFYERDISENTAVLQHNIRILRRARAVIYDAAAGGRTLACTAI